MTLMHSFHAMIINIQYLPIWLFSCYFDCLLTIQRALLVTGDVTLKQLLTAPVVLCDTRTTNVETLGLHRRVYSGNPDRTILMLIMKVRRYSTCTLCRLVHQQQVQHFSLFINKLMGGGIFIFTSSYELHKLHD